MNASLHPALKHPQSSRPSPDPDAVRKAFVALIAALGLEGVCDSQTAERAQSLWLKHLIAGQNADLPAAVGEVMVSAGRAPIVIEPIGFHLVCPHHLTIASGCASIAYVPAGHIVGFGRVAKLVSLATARLALQEDAAHDIAQTLMQVLGARAVAVRLRAEHLCHTVLHPRSHGAQASTWGLLGDAETCTQLQALLGH